jgi:preprotein translocase subunit SecE
MATTNPTTPTAMSRFGAFMHEVWVELKKTTWPTTREAWRLTVVVIGVIVAVAVYVGAIDFVLTTLTRKFQIIK